MTDENSINLSSGQKAYLRKIVNEVKNDIENYKNELLNGVDGKESIKAQIEKALQRAQEIESKYTEIVEYHSSLLEGDDENLSIQDDLNQIKEELNNSIESINSKKDDINAFYAKIFGYEDKDGKKFIGLKEEIENSKKELKKIKDEKESEYEELFKKIESLLPGATSTGLARAYQNQKDQYYIPNILWSFIFIGTMGGMIAYAVLTLSSGGSLTEITARTLSKLPFYIPAIWLGIYASKQQSQNKRLAQEYAFKETLARSYEGYKKQIDNLGQSKEAKAVMITLIQNLITIAGQNPSLTLDSKIHNDEPPLLSKAMQIFAGKKEDE